MRFDPDVREHAEAICLRCHRIDDVLGSAGRPPLPSELAGYQIVRRAETFYGYCPECRAGDAQPADDVAAKRA
jgi:Fe2+ or Zn2+ uptake regulation protein